MMWTGGVRGRAGMVIHQIPMERVHVWVWLEKLEGKQPTTLSQPPPATESQRQAEFTPRAVGTGATGNEEGRLLCQADQQNQYADSSCSIGAHGLAMMAHDSCHVRSMKRPAYKHRWDNKAAKRKTSEDSMRNKRWWDPAVDMHDSSRPAVRQNRQQRQHQPRDRHKPQMA